MDLGTSHFVDLPILRPLRDAYCLLLFFAAGVQLLTSLDSLRQLAASLDIH